MTGENESKPPVFSEWEDCDCNQCERYWDSSCDAVGKDKRKPCTQYSATRKVIIPLQIERLQKKINYVMWSEILIALGIILHIIGGCFR